MPFGTEKKLEWCGYPTVKIFCRYVYSFWQNVRTWQTHTKTDRHTHGHRMTAKAAQKLSHTEIFRQWLPAPVRCPVCSLPVKHFHPEYLLLFKRILYQFLVCYTHLDVSSCVRRLLSSFRCWGCCRFFRLAWWFGSATLQVLSGNHNRWLRSRRMSVVMRSHKQPTRSPHISAQTSCSNCCKLNIVIRLSRSRFGELWLVIISERV